MTPRPLTTVALRGLSCGTYGVLTKAMVGGVSVRTDGDGGSRDEVLVVDDDRDLVDMLAFLVDQAGLTALVASDPSRALELMRTHDPSVAVVDLNLRPFDGFELLADMRRENATLPIIVLTARTAEDDKVRALDLGADDYVEKPFGHRELIARIRAHARRSDRERGVAPTETVLKVGPLRLDLQDRTLQVDGRSVRLTATEFRLVQYLIRNCGSVVPTEAIAKHVWGYNDAPARDVVRVTVHRLRRKLCAGGQPSQLIETVPGIGLRLQVD